eukprot:SAG31_NODE_8274_length_1482_cov_1.261027_1_plen_50_part_00
MAWLLNQGACALKAGDANRAIEMCSAVRSQLITVEICLFRVKMHVHIPT